jgi:hypothetical protein
MKYRDPVTLAKDSEASSLKSIAVGSSLKKLYRPFVFNPVTGNRNADHEAFLDSLDYRNPSPDIRC